MKLNKVISQIFKYENYRTFLRDYFIEQKQLMKIASLLEGQDLLLQVFVPMSWMERRTFLSNL